MALTKVSGGILDPGINVAGIVTATGFDGPFIGGSDGINSGVVTCTGLDVNGNGDISGNLVVGGNLTANGDFTTLNTTLREVELLRVDANSSVAAGIITQTGAGDLLRLYDGASQVVTVDDTGKVGIGSETPAQKLDVVGNMKISGNIDANGDLDVDGLTNLDNTIVAGIATFTNVVTKFKAGNGGNTHLQVLSTGSGEAGIFFDAANGDISGSDYCFIGQQDNLDFVIKANPNAGNIDFQRGTDTKVRIDTSGNLNVNYDLDVTGNAGIGSLSVTGISTFNDHVNVVQGKKINFGNTNGTTGHVYYDGSTTRFQTNSGFNIGAPVISLKSGNLAAVMGEFVATGSVKLFYDYANNNDPKFQTTGYGVTVTGITSATSFTASEGGISGQYTRNQIKWDRNSYNYIDCTNDSGQFAIRMGSSQIAAFSVDTSADTIFPNNRKIKMGNDKLQLYHTGSKAIINNSTGDLDIRGDVVRIKKYDASKTMASFIAGGQAEFNYDTTRRLHTSPTGIVVTGEVAASQDYPNFRPSLNFNFAGEKKLEPRVTYERTGPASFTDEFGKVVLVGGNVPRFDHHPDTKESLGLLIEPKKTNQWLYSEDLVTYLTGGNLQAATLENTTETTDPTGGTNAVKMAATATGGAHSVWKNFTSGSAGEAHTFSVWVKAAGANYARIYVDTVGGNINGPGVTFSTGNVWNLSATGVATQVTTSAVKYPNGWWRLSTTGYFSNTTQYYFHIDIEGGEGDIGYTGNGSNGIYVWGAQVESSTQTNVTSYIPTYGAAVTRGDDIVKLDGEDFTDFYNQEEGTLVSEFKIFDRIQSSAAIANINALSSSSYADSIMFMEVGHVNGYFGRVYKNSNGINLDGSSDQSSIVQNGNQTNKVSFGWSATSVNQGLAAYLNGTLQEESTDESRTPTNMTELRIGTGWQQNSSENQTWAIHAHIKKLAYYPKRLSNNQLATLTS